jgi:hypothetical protein
MGSNLFLESPTLQHHFFNRTKCPNLIIVDRPEEGQSLSHPAPQVLFFNESTWRVPVPGTPFLQASASLSGYIWGSLLTNNHVVLCVTSLSDIKSEPVTLTLMCSQRLAKIKNGKNGTGSQRLRYHRLVNQYLDKIVNQEKPDMSSERQVN